MRATSNQTRYAALCATPCASVSANLTATSVEKRKPSMYAVSIGCRDRVQLRTVSAERLAALIVDRQPCVVLTGAGVSTESGIPDFRSASGIWAEFDPMEYATIDAFRRDPEK